MSVLLLHVLTDCSQMDRFDESRVYVHDYLGTAIDDFRAKSNCMLDVVTTEIASRKLSHLLVYRKTYL